MLEYKLLFVAVKFFNLNLGLFTALDLTLNLLYLQ